MAADALEPRPGDVAERLRSDLEKVSMGRSLDTRKGYTVRQGLTIEVLKGATFYVDVAGETLEVEVRRREA